jgi:hypothetical protein
MSGLPVAGPPPKGQISLRPFGSDRTVPTVSAEALGAVVGALSVRAPD